MITVRRMHPGAAAVAVIVASAALAGAPAFAQQERLEPPVAVEAPNPIQNQPGSPSTPRGLSSSGPEIPTVSPASPDDALPFSAEAMDEALLYAGFRVEDLTGEAVLGGEGGLLGVARDLVFSRDGAVEALVAESGGVLDLGNAYARIPWSAVALTPGEEGVVAAITAESTTLDDPFGEDDWIRTGPREFRATEVIGDYVSLANQTGFGIVVDLVVHPDGRLLAALVSRRAALGGGLFAYPFTGRAERFGDQVETIELPYGTPDEAGRALRVDPERFADPL